MIFRVKRIIRVQDLEVWKKADSLAIENRISLKIH